MSIYCNFSAACSNAVNETCTLKHLNDSVMKHHALNSAVRDSGRLRPQAKPPVTSMAFPAFLGLGLSKNILDLNNFWVGNLSHDKRRFRSVQGMLVMRVKLTKHLMFTVRIVVCIIQN